MSGGLLFIGFLAIVGGGWALYHSPVGYALIALGLLAGIAARLAQATEQQAEAVRQHEEVMEVLRKTFAAGQSPAPIPPEGSAAAVQAEEFRM
jgi:hypothetical protein